MKQETILKDLSKEPRFRLDWSEMDFTNIQKAITAHFKRTGINLEKGQIVPNSWGSVDQCLGLAYTSSSSYAMYSVCNVNAYLDFGHIYRYVCFGIDIHHNYYATLWDKDENEIIIPI
jgi:hypothetical protein